MVFRHLVEKKMCIYAFVGCYVNGWILLGLGNRHLCNPMIHRCARNVLHIDFGDCFRVAILRDKLPEKVTFLLTRMSVNSLEMYRF